MLLPLGLLLIEFAAFTTISVHTTTTTTGPTTNTSMVLITTTITIPSIINSNTFTSILTYTNTTNIKTTR